MNKLIKSAMMMASVGAMLCTVGCGKELTPAEQADKQIAAFYALIAECGGTVPQDAKAGMSAAPEAERIKIATEISNVFPKLKQYGKLVKDANVLCKKLNEDPPVSADKMCEKFGSFAEHPEKIDPEIKELELGIDFLKKAAAEKK